MKFFTPELYRRFNSPDDTIADRADEEWERAVRDYKSYLSEHSVGMNDRVKELAEGRSLHDAELLSIQEDVPDRYHPTPLNAPVPVATVSVRDGGEITNLIYLLWSRMEQSPPEADWPFSGLRTHWLYDEIDVEPRPSYFPFYRHEILWSDGRVVSIPFFDVIIQSYSDREPETAIVAKTRA